jgi:hypothetical protein
MEELKKTMENLSEESRSLSQDLNPGPPKYKAGALTTRPRCLNVNFVLTALYVNGFYHYSNLILDCIINTLTELHNKFDVNCKINSLTKNSS